MDERTRLRIRAMEDPIFAENKRLFEEANPGLEYTEDDDYVGGMAETFDRLKNGARLTPNGGDEEAMRSQFLNDYRRIDWDDKTEVEHEINDLLSKLSKESASQPSYFISQAPASMGGRISQRVGGLSPEEIAYQEEDYRRRVRQAAIDEENLRKRQAQEGRMQR